MDSEPTFTGSSAKECEDFVRALRKQGRAEGKLRDDKYMADLASVSFEGSALRWYARLDRKTRDSWDLLQMALLDNYTHPDDLAPARSPSISTSSIPTPAAAAPTPSPQRRPLSFDVPGRIRIIPDDYSASQFISFNQDREFGIILACNDPSEALIVRCTDAPHKGDGHSGPHSFSMTGQASRGLPGLGIIQPEWTRTRSPSIWFTNVAMMSINEANIRSSAAMPGTVRSVVWDLCYHDGGIRALWEEEEGSYLLTPVINLVNKRIMLVNNFESFCNDNAGNSYSRARLVFEPI